MGCGASSVAPAGGSTPPTRNSNAEEGDSLGLMEETEQGEQGYSRSSIVGDMPSFTRNKKDAQVGRLGRAPYLSAVPSPDSTFAEVKASESYMSPKMADSRRASLSLPKEIRKSMEIGDSGYGQQRTVRMSRGHSISEEVPLEHEAVTEIQQTDEVVSKPEALAEEAEELDTAQEVKPVVGVAVESASLVAESNGDK